jgi:flagellin-like protein
MCNSPLPTHKQNWRKTVKNTRQNKKALSPVVASIILLAAAVAISLATCGWLGALTLHYTGTTAITVNNAQFTGPPGQTTNTIVLSLKNTGTQGVTIDTVEVNEKKFDFNPSQGENTTYNPAESKDLVLRNVDWQPGLTYTFEILGNGAQTVGAYQTNALGT